MTLGSLYITHLRYSLIQQEPLKIFSRRAVAKTILPEQRSRERDTEEPQAGSVYMDTYANMHRYLIRGGSWGVLLCNIKLKSNKKN